MNGAGRQRIRLRQLSISWFIKSKSVDGITARMPAFVTKYMGTDDDNAQQKSFIIQPLSELHSDMRFGTYNKKMPTVAAISFTVIGVFLLLTACVNFINLTTAEAVKRTKEVGIRKTLGSTRGQLILKFISETFLVTLAAVALSLALTQVALALLNPFLGSIDKTEPVERLYAGSSWCCLL